MSAWAQDGALGADWNLRTALPDRGQGEPPNNNKTPT